MRAAQPPGPAAALGAPVKTPSEGVTTPLSGSEPRDARPASPVTTTPGLPPPVHMGDPTLIADKGKKDGVDGFTRGVPAAIEGPGRDPAPEKPALPPMYTPPLPPEIGGSAEGTTTPLLPSASAIPSPPPAPPATLSRTVVPACDMNGNLVNNFALYDVQGKAWELREHRSKLVLLDFWYSGCAPCREALPHLTDLQKKYSRYGLQVVGIAYESGSPEEKQQAVRSIRTRYGLNYTILFGEKNNCPVQKQFEVTSFPTLILLDESGKTLFRSEGLTPQAAYDLEIEIRRQVGLRLK